MAVLDIVDVRPAAMLGASLELLDVGCREGGGEAWMHGALLSLGLFTASSMSCDIRPRIGKTERI